MSLGSDVEDEVIEERLKQQRADQCVGVVFSVSVLAYVHSYLVCFSSGVKVQAPIVCCRQILVFGISNLCSLARRATTRV